MENSKVRKILIMLPAYNESATIEKVLKQISELDFGEKEKEVLVVDDGSSDNTVEIVSGLGWVKIIRHDHNQGVGAAFHTGLNYALRNKADALVTIDADGQFDPADIPRLIDPIENHEAEFVTASRFIDRSKVPEMPRSKLWGNGKVASIVSWVVGKRYHDVSCGFRAYGRSAMLNLNLFGKFTYTHEVFLDLGFKGLKIKEVPVKVNYFSDRKSRVANSLMRYAWKILGIIMSSMRDYKPLRFFGLIGVTVFLLGIVLDLFVLWHFISSGEFSPYKAVGVAGIVANVFGTAFFILGFVADMLTRVRMNQEELLYYSKKSLYDK